MGRTPLADETEKHPAFSNSATSPTAAIPASRALWQQDDLETEDDAPRAAHSNNK